MTSAYLLLESAIIQVHPRFGIEIRLVIIGEFFLLLLFLHILYRISPVVPDLLLLSFFFCFLLVSQHCE